MKSFHVSGIFLQFKIENKTFEDIVTVKNVRFEFCQGRKKCLAVHHNLAQIARKIVDYHSRHFQEIAAPKDC